MLLENAPSIDLRPAWWPRRGHLLPAAVAALTLGLAVAAVRAYAVSPPAVGLAPASTLVAALAARIPTEAPPRWDDGLVREPRLAYLRGKRRTIEVVHIAGVEMEINTARAFVAMRDAAAAAGVDLEVSSGFRGHDEQRKLYRAWRKRIGYRAARPGRSNHQSGRAIDFIVLNNPAARAWLNANAPGFGFARTVRGEPWHWEHLDAPRAAAPRRPKHRGHEHRGHKRQRSR